MVKRTVTNMKEDVCLEVELLNQTCLELVAKIERLEKENTWLKKTVLEESGSRGRPELSGYTQ